MQIHGRVLAVLVAAALAGPIPAAHADDAAALTHEILAMDAAAASGGAGAVSGRIAADFRSFAGSRENASSLVAGLRNATAITLTQRGYPPAIFTPSTQPMGYGNVSIALSLAQHQLAQQGITNPTPEQLKIALNGGTIVYGGRTVVYAGILEMRADGLGWGEIAQQLGTKLGPVVSGIKSQNAGLAATRRAEPHAPGSGAAAGVTAAANARAAGGAKGAPGSGKGIVDAGGGNAHGMARGKDDAGASTARNRAQPPGRGIVSASGQPLGAGAAHGAAQGHAAAGHAAGGAVTAAGVNPGSTGAGGPGQGKALGHNK